MQDPRPPAPGVSGRNDAVAASATSGRGCAVPADRWVRIARAMRYAWREGRAGPGRTVKTQCERDEWSLRRVAAVDRAARESSISCWTCAVGGV